MKRCQGAFDRVHFLLRVERVGTLSIPNHYLNENLEKRYAMSLTQSHTYRANLVETAISIKTRTTFSCSFMLRVF